MITYNKERGAWDFRQVTEDEREELLKLAERAWAHVMASNIAQHWIQEEQAAHEEANKPAVRIVEQEPEDNVIPVDFTRLN